ncbi:MAG: Smr/MutS family protein, partial [Myxococcales bacterium]|nr:Smr/MutS family protein [Myxococcales bacterium]
DEALERLEKALDAATQEGRAALTIVHGIGTGALRRAIRESLARSPYVGRFMPGSADEGGEGVTVAQLDP